MNCAHPQTTTYGKLSQYVENYRTSINRRKVCKTMILYGGMEIFVSKYGKNKANRFFSFRLLYGGDEEMKTIS
jgi:hypothetical protein